MSNSAQSGPPPAITTTPPKGKGRTSSAAQGKRNNRNNNNNRKQSAHVDGAVSDSVATGSYPQNRRPNKQSQSTAHGAYLQYGSNQNGDAIGHQKTRPASMGGPMLPGTPAKERAYAQSTFQASPAASALPVPKFFGSRSVPSASAPSSLQARMDGEKAPEEPQESSPEPDIVSPIKQSHGQNRTPLDVFFMADKAEKERKSSPGIHNLSPDLAVRPLPVSEPRNPFLTSKPSLFAKGISDAEGPVTSPKTVPQDQRPAPYRAHSSPGGVANSPNQQNLSNEQSTQALKDLLFNNLNNKPNSTPPKNHQRMPSNSNGIDEYHATPSPGQQRSALGPTTPTPVKYSQDHYSLHYGNRNLSPMFQAARNETPPRPSNLRQQINHPGQQNGFPQYNQKPFSNHSDPNTFSRSYLDQQIRSSLPAQPPSGLISNGNNSNNSSAPFSGPSHSQHSMQMPNGTSGSPRNSGTRDMKGMEDDLRRMLNLNVLG